MGLAGFHGVVKQGVNLRSNYSRIGIAVCFVTIAVAIFWNGEARAESNLERLSWPSDNLSVVPYVQNHRPSINGARLNPNIYVGYMSSGNGVRAGYTGLVLPGTCVSSYFVYNLEGIVLAAQAPVNISKEVSMRLGASYLVAMKTNADQEITWLTFPPGVREWDWTRSSLYALQAEVDYSVGTGYSLLGGFRWESLVTNFGDPNPNYYFTASGMESALSVGNYQPFIGAQVEQKFGNSTALLRLIGFPAMLASIEHFNTCNNRGVPFAHVGSANISSGYFIEATGEIGFLKSSTCELSGFLSWESFRGTCQMNLERRDAGPPETVSAATVDFLYDRSSLIFGGKVSIPLATPY